VDRSEPGGFAGYVRDLLLIKDPQAEDDDGEYQQ
jgi:hypothetical protein